MELTCSCGGGNGAYHPLGIGGCFRRQAIGNEIPTNFRKKNGIEVCDVRGYTITVFTLLHQRMYAKKAEGVWSLPKDESSINSLEGDW